MPGRWLPIGTSALRLSDAERERALAALKRNYAEGRLSVDELEVRVGDVMHAPARTHVAFYLRDLPWRGARALLVRRVRRWQRAILRMHAATFLAVNAALVGIWALTGEGTFWPALLLIPTTAMLGWHIAASRALTRALTRRGW
jgi:hypothetical protein